MFEFFRKRAESKKNVGWHRWLTTQYHIMQVCLALEDVRFFQEVKGKKFVIKEIAGKLNLQEYILKICVEFLWSVSDIFLKEGDLFELQAPNISSFLWGAKEYQPVINDLAALIRREKKYGVDLIRDGYYLQKSSDIFSHDAMNKLFEVLNYGHVGQLLIDLGCGSANTLIRYCAGEISRIGIGIDISEDIVKEAKKHVIESGLEKRISILKENVFDINRWRNHVRDREAIFIASAVLHEFLIKGENTIIDFFRGLKSNFPGSRMFIIELDAQTFEEIKKESNLERKFFTAMYQLWHPLTNQGMPQNREIWRSLIESSGITINQIFDNLKFNLVIFDCKL